MIVITDQRLTDTVVVEKFESVPRVFAGDEVAFLQNPHGAEGDVFQVADRRGHQVQDAGHVRRGHSTVSLTGCSIYFGSLPPVRIIKLKRPGLAAGGYLEFDGGVGLLGYLDLQIVLAVGEVELIDAGLRQILASYGQYVTSLAVRGSTVVIRGIAC